MSFQEGCGLWFSHADSSGELGPGRVQCQATHTVASSRESTKRGSVPIETYTSVKENP